MKPCLTYFAIRGRAEPIRLLLHLMGVDFDDRHVALQEWPTLKLTTPFGSLPIYEEDGIRMTQSVAILHHLADRHGLMGNTVHERVRCRTTIEAARDVFADASALFWSPRFAKERDAYVHDKLPARLLHLERYFAAGACDTHWVGEGLTCGDIYAWAMLNAIQPLAPELLARHGKLSAFKQSFEARPGVAAFLADPARPATYTLSIAAFGGTRETSGV